MGILSGLLGTSDEMSSESLNEELSGFLVETERIRYACKAINKRLVFTNKRLIIYSNSDEDSGQVQYSSVPYHNIGSFDMEYGEFRKSESKITLYLLSSGRVEEVFLDSDVDVKQLYKLLSEFIFLL